MKFKGTKGSWLVLNEGKFGIYIKDFKNTSAISKVYTDNNLIKSLEEAEANAKLISCAPEMLEMLELYSTLNENHYKEFSGFILKTRELIKKATEL